MAAVVPSEEVGVAVSEEVGMAVLGKDMLGAPSYAHEQSLEDLETTLLWGEVYCNSTREGVAMLEVSESDVRPSPEGSREEARVDNAVDHEAFSKMPTTEEEEDSNSMPEVAAHVFVPIDPYCIERPLTRDEKKRWEYEEEEIVRCEKEKENLEKQNFLSRGYSAHHFNDLPSCDGEPAQTCMERLSCCSQNCRCSSASLKAVASMVGATTIFPCLLYGAYVFLPFDVPQMPTMSSRLVYTLRCGAFATFPIVVGMIVYGASRLCFSSLQPFGELRREVEIHRRYVSQSVHLFILYFFNIAVLSTYLPQENLKLIPLLTALFAISRLLYWLAYAMGRSFRGFGFGLTFLPLVTMLLFNLYSMFLMDSESLFVTTGNREPPLEKEQRLAASKPRYWG